MPFENTIEKVLNLWEISGIYLNIISRTSQDFPQPVCPINIRLLFATMLVSTRYPYLIVSMVCMNLVKIVPNFLKPP